MATFNDIIKTGTEATLTYGDYAVFDAHTMTYGGVLYTFDLFNDTTI